MQRETSSFPPTDWSLIGHVVGDDAIETRRLSLDELLSRYLPAMRRFVRRKFRVDAHVADDWVQGFVTSKILQNQLLARVQQDGRSFRSFLSHALSDFAIDQRRQAKREASAANDHAATIDTAASLVDPATTLERSWAEQALEAALTRTKDRLCATKRGPAWAVFSRRFLEPHARPRDYRSLTAEFAFDTPKQAAMALRTAKRVFRAKLSEVLIEFGTRKSGLPAAISELRKNFQI